MARPQLRVFFGPEDGDRVLDNGSIARGEVRVPLGEILPLLVDAVHARRGWVDDFRDDTVTVSTDLYEVLMAYRQLRSSA